DIRIECMRSQRLPIFKKRPARASGIARCVSFFRWSRNRATPTIPLDVEDILDHTCALHWDLTCRRVCQFLANLCIVRTEPLWDSGRLRTPFLILAELLPRLIKQM